MAPFHFAALAAALYSTHVSAADPYAGKGPDTSDVDNVLFASYILISLAAVIVAIISYHVILRSARHLRHLTSLGKDSQRYFRTSPWWFAQLKQHLFYAPVFRMRQAREILVLPRWSLGVLPSRFQSLLLTGIIAMNITLCLTGIEWADSGTPNMLNHLRNRAGTLAVVNMIPLVIMAGRNNPLIALTGVSYDTFNMFHRWFGRMCVAEAITHVVCFLVKDVKLVGWSGLGALIQQEDLLYTGLTAFVAFVVIYLTANTFVRRLCYELFAHLHVLLAITAIAALWYHLKGLPQHKYIEAVIGLWAAERAIRLLTLLYRNVGPGGTHALLEALPGDAVRITMRVKRPWTFRPGQHMFVTIPAIGLWTAHPFSVAWSEELDNQSLSRQSSPDSLDPRDPEKGPYSAQHALSDRSSSILHRRTTTVSAVVRQREGFTGKLLSHVSGAPGGRVSLRAIVEGPYGLQHSLDSYGSVVLFAGGVGITHQLPYVRSLVAGYGNGTCAARRVLLVWVLQAPEHLEWIRPWMTQVLALEGRRNILRVHLFITRPRSAKEIHSPSSTVQMFPGRPNVNTILTRECDTQVGAMAVSVCGPGSLADEVRLGVRSRQTQRNIDLYEESFSW